MKIDIGDQVRFLNDVGGGTVTGILGKDMVNVETTDGFEVPTYIRNLVVIHVTDSNEKGKSEINKVEEKKESFTDFREEPKRSTFLEKNQIKGNDNPEFIFAFVPDNPANPPAGNIEMYLINDCNFTLLYQFSVKTGDQYETLDSGNLEPNTKINLGTIQPKSIGELPAYCFQLIYFKRFSKQMEEPVQMEVAISPIKFFKPATFTKTNYFKVPSLIIKLVDNPVKAELEKLTEKDFQQIAFVKEPKKITTPHLPSLDLLEIDLHIEQLIDDLRGMNNGEILKVQLDTFRKEMENAIRTGIKKVVFIHGVGDGVLKNEIRRELQRKYGKYSFQDASFREYGFGATMVILKR